jgi:uncharacterized protein with HEPN domain
VKDDHLFLDHIYESISHIETFTNAGQSAFSDSILIQSAVLRMLQILTESSQRISEGLKANYPDIDWRGMAGLRNVVAHDYFNIKLTIIWNIIQNDLPDLKTKVAVIIQQLDNP